MGESPDLSLARPAGPGSSQHLTALSSLLVFGAIGAMLYQELVRGDTPPAVEITVERVLDLGDRYVVEFVAHNRGDATAAGLVVEGTLEADTARVETASVNIDYVPARAMRRGGLYFRNDPREYRLSVESKGYDRP